MRWALGSKMAPWVCICECLSTKHNFTRNKAIQAGLMLCPRIHQG
jgi:hypothetical protein